MGAQLHKLQFAQPALYSFPLCCFCSIFFCESFCSFVLRVLRVLPSFDRSFSLCCVALSLLSFDVGFSRPCSFLFALPCTQMLYCLSAPLSPRVIDSPSSTNTPPLLARPTSWRPLRGNLTPHVRRYTPAPITASRSFPNRRFLRSWSALAQPRSQAGTFSSLPASPLGRIPLKNPRCGRIATPALGEPHAVRIGPLGVPFCPFHC